MNPGLDGKLCIQNMVNNKMVNEYFEVPIELVTSDNVHKYKNEWRYYETEIQVFIEHHTKKMLFYFLSSLYL